LDELAAQFRESGEEGEDEIPTITAPTSAPRHFLKPSRPNILFKRLYSKMTDFSLKGKNVNVAMMTSGGLAPCLSCSIAQLAHYWVDALKNGEIAGLTLRMYKDGYKGVLIGDSFIVPEEEWSGLDALNFIGGSPIGNSRVKVTMVVPSSKMDFDRRAIHKSLTNISFPSLKLAVDQCRRL
jgi:hypothetical protein